MAATSFSPFEVSDFSNGITDQLYGQDTSFCDVADNFVIDSNGKLLSRPGSEIDITDPDDDQIPGGITRIATIINYDNDDNLFIHAEKKIYWRDPQAYATLTGPTGNDVLSTGDDNSLLSYSQWNKHIFLTSDALPRPQKIFKDDNGDYQLRTSGLPRLSTSPTITPGAAGTRSYVYAFHYEYTYMVNDQTFQSLGAVTLVEVSNSGDPSVNNNAITAIPVIANGATDNWDTVTIKVFIFRTIDAGDTFYKIGEVTNGTTVFTDSYSDTSIQENDLLYTTDDTVEFDPTPEAKFVHVVNNTGYYGHIKKEDGEVDPFMGRQSVPAIPDATPVDFEFRTEDVIKGISSVKSIPIYLCSRHVYRIDGAFDRFGRGFANPIRISDTAGCVSNLSIVQASVSVSGRDGIFWFGNDGVYFSDGYQVIKVSDHLNQRYKRYLSAQTNPGRIYGKFDEREQRVLWGIQTDSGSLDNDTIIVLDLRNGVSSEMPFTTWSGNSFRPTSLEFFEKQLYRGDTRGYIFVHDEEVLTDPKVDTNEDAENWARETIIWLHRSLHFNFGSTFFRKLPTRILLTAENRGNTTIQINAINDAGKIVRELNVIRWRKNFTWDDEEFTWGNPDCAWDSTGIIEQWRRFPARGLRVSYLQVEITNGYSPITNSDTQGTATFDGVTNQITLDTVGSSWPADSVDYFIATEDDDYETEFLVTVRNSDSIITVADSNDVLPSGSFRWVMRGFKKDEALNLLSYNIFWNNVSQTQETFETGSSGENA